ncbi:conserved hypothetical protein [Desulfamplus magnetovallimortis]|uniref:DUF3782 domain-containing protein n=1 Tax=Desulfamplus magnetovallimortis TaxID=1246637 RepID=L0R5E5_9BACT|nr:DUF3782 domain-containing protein [Desulfamplus magnetovallimortis]CCO06740.1 conserved hypothetical protein [Desulfamplus magnetovallimortis BW-1]SLM32791.1 conserved hypothetical protein [Desulfamplus magnetovallimortis]
MEQALSPDNILNFFQEIKDLYKETDRLIKEQSQEAERRSKETDRKFQETDRKFQETDRKIQETDRIIKNLSKNLGALGNRLGEFVENMVSPAVVKLFQSMGIKVHEVYPGVEARRNGEGIEIDLLVVNDNTLIAVECKSKLAREHVDEHVIRMEKLKRLLPLYKNHKALGCVAAMVMSESVKTYAHSKGFYVLYQNGEGVDISRPEGFNPRVW